MSNDPPDEVWALISPGFPFQVQVSSRNCLFYIGIVQKDFKVICVFKKTREPVTAQRQLRIILLYNSITSQYTSLQHITLQSYYLPCDACTHRKAQLSCCYFSLYMCKRTTKYVHYRKERKTFLKKSFTFTLLKG